MHSSWFFRVKPIARLIFKARNFPEAVQFLTNPYYVASGVPQGSVLGPLLFLLYVNDISSVVTNSTVKLFADDVTIYKEIACPADVHLLQLDLSKVVQWAKTWLLRLNPDKCESIVLSNKRSPPVPHYYLDTELISSKPVIRYLGILVDSHLTWNDHCF